MSDESYLAFSHPIERAKAMGDHPYDRISLRDYVVEVEIGAFQAERGHLQRVQFNVVVEVLPARAAGDDDVDDILSYDRITEAIDGELNAERMNLLETLAARVADRILLEPQAERVFIRIEKLDKGPFALGVEIVRSAAGLAPSDTRLHAQDVEIIFVPNEAIGLDGVARAVLEYAQHKTVIMCVGTHDFGRPAAQTLEAQRCIDLLAIGQNAWRLSSDFLECHVVETRTELDWVLKNQRISVWDPMKMILNAVREPDWAVLSSPNALVSWLSRELEAATLTQLTCGDSFRFSPFLVDHETKK